MSKIQKRDYYFGAPLSKLLSKNPDSRPSLVECSDYACEYKMITDTSEDFCIYMKYAGGSDTLKDGGKAWQVKLTETDKERIEACINSGNKTFLIIVGGEMSKNDGEIIVITQDEYHAISHKSHIRVKAAKNSKKYTIVDKAGNDMYVYRNRFDMRLTDIA